MERRPAPINWEKLKQTENADKFHARTRELFQECQWGDWDDIAQVLTQAAKEVCGLQKRPAANPWTIGHEEELAELHSCISGLVLRRNELMGRRRTRSTSNEADYELEVTRGLLKTERKRMKKRLRQLEKEWWKTAAKMGDLGTVYSTLKK